MRIREFKFRGILAGDMGTVYRTDCFNPSSWTQETRVTWTQQMGRARGRGHTRHNIVLHVFVVDSLVVRGGAPSEVRTTHGTQQMGPSEPGQDSSGHGGLLGVRLGE